MATSNTPAPASQEANVIETQSPAIPENPASGAVVEEAPAAPAGDVTGLAGQEHAAVEAGVATAGAASEGTDAGALVIESAAPEAQANLAAGLAKRNPELDAKLEELAALHPDQVEQYLKNLRETNPALADTLDAEIGGVLAQTDGKSMDELASYLKALRAADPKLFAILNAPGMLNHLVAGARARLGGGVDSYELDFRRDKLSAGLDTVKASPEDVHPGSPIGRVEEAGAKRENAVEAKQHIDTVLEEQRQAVADAAETIPVTETTAAQPAAAPVNAGSAIPTVDDAKREVAKDVAQKAEADTPEVPGAAAVAGDPAAQAELKKQQEELERMQRQMQQDAAVRAALDQGRNEGMQMAQQAGAGAAPGTGTVGGAIGGLLTGMAGGLRNMFSKAPAPGAKQEAPTLLDDRAGAEREELVRRDMARAKLAINDREGALKEGVPFFMDRFHDARQSHQDALIKLETTYPKASGFLKEHGVEATQAKPELMAGFKAALAAEGGVEGYNALVKNVNAKEGEVMGLTREAIGTCERSGNVDGLQEVMDMTEESCSHGHPLAKLDQGEGGEDVLDTEPETDAPPANKTKLDDDEKKSNNKMLERLVEMFRKLMERLGLGGKKVAP